MKADVHLIAEFGIIHSRNRSRPRGAINTCMAADQTSVSAGGWLMSDYILIPLSRGKHAIIDAEDADRVMAFKWSAIRPQPQLYPDRYYGFRQDYSGDRPVGIYLHRFILGVVGGLKVDHANGDGLDCRRSNLRPATTSQNTHNTKCRRGGSSEFRGVSKRRNRWVAEITVDKVTHRIGSFESEILAAQAYDEEAVRRVGEFAVLNFPEAVR